MEPQVSTQSAPVALTIAGSDSGANAGIQADLMTFAANGVYGVSALTCITAQNPNGVASLHPVPPEVVVSQIDQVVSFYNPCSIKTGMLYSAAIIDTVSTTLASLQPAPPIIVDPVMVATSGSALIDDEAIQSLKNRLLPLADLITPNLDEAESLVGTPVRALEEINSAARKLAEKYDAAILIKGGHLDGDDLVDTLCLADGSLISFPQKRIPRIDTHGSECTLSAAIAAWASRNCSIEESVSRGLRYLRKAMERPVFINGLPYINHFP